MKRINWITDKTKNVFVESSSKEPIDLSSPEKVIGKYFASQAEVEDVLDVIKQVKNPNLIGIIGSRASLKRPPLFENINSFHSYHNKKAKGDLLEYLDWECLDIKDYELAEKYLKNGFNERYMQGKKYPEPIVRLLVSDIDLKINSGSKDFRGGPRIGKRTNVTLDVDSRLPYPGAIPLKYK
jgi:hypothetical protein